MPDELIGLQHDVPLAPYTTLKIGGPAKYFLKVKTIKQASEAMTWAKKQNVVWNVLGAGSNILISDKGFNGLVLVMQNDQLEYTGQKVLAGAGATNGQLIASALRHDLGGISWLLGVPGTVGGSIYGNAGTGNADAVVRAIGDLVSWVEVIAADGQRHRLNKHDCHFAYRHSVFKETRLLIVQAELDLPKVDQSAERLKLAQLAKQKNGKQPLTAASAGCMFKNSTIEVSRLPAPLHPFVLPNGTISSWRLIDYLGLKGKQIGQIQISQQHGNFMINLGGGTADHVVQLLSLVKQKVRDTLGIQLQEEVQYLGF